MERSGPEVDQRVGGEQRRHRTKAAASFSPPHANSPLEIPPPSYRLAALGSFYFWTGLGIGLLLSSGAREGTDGGEATEPSGGL